MEETSRLWTGGCLCGAIRYEITMQPGPVSFCHCGQCRRQHGHVGAYTTFPRDAFRLVGGETLRWYQASEKARRGFCAACGTVVFWDPIGEGRLDVTAGSFDEPTGLKADRHIFVEFKGDYYVIGDDGLDRIESTSPGSSSALA